MPGVAYEFIDETLREVGLGLPQLNVLVPDVNKYRTLAYQYRATVIAENNNGVSIRSQDRENSFQKFQAYINLAAEKNADLVLTPEYSCPWRNIQYIIDNNIFPQEGKLWILGCESILVSEMQQFIERNNGEVVILSEAFENAVENKFLDPIIYIFQTNNNVGESRVVLLCQYKTLPMGKAFEFEMDNMEWGKRRYIIRNDDESINLVTMICSESLGFNEKQFKNLNGLPYLIFHPQLNSAPRNINFCSYRSSIFNFQADPKTDVICLNWGKGTTINGDAITIECPHSAIYIKSEGTTNEVYEPRLKANELLGMHYHYWTEARTAAFVLEYCDRVFYFENYKSSQITAAAQLSRARRGPKMLNNFSFNNNVFASTGTCDKRNLKDYFKELGLNLDDLIDSLEPLDIERFVTVSSGEIQTKYWLNLLKNKLIGLNSQEESNRFILIEDPTTIQNKETLGIQIKSLLEYFSDPENIPGDSQLVDLKSGCEFKFQTNQLGNVESTIEKIPAILIYAGHIPKKRVLDLRDSIIESQNKKSHNTTKRMLIWYNDGTLQCEYSPIPPKASASITIGPTSFRKTHDK